MSDGLIIATSLSPIDDRNVQPMAMGSWLSHGFTVLSVNTAEEIEQLADQYPDIRFVVAERTAERFAGRPVPFIFDLLQAAKKEANGNETIGITNADIFLRPAPGLGAFFTEAAKGAVVLGPRVDVGDPASFETYAPDVEPEFSVGYDYFLMSRDVVDDFEDSPFAMGMPFWDYWLPLSVHLAGRPLKALKSPIALHVSHDTRWDDTIYLFFHALIAYALEQGRKNADQDDAAGRQLAFFLDVVSHTYGHIFENGTAGTDGEQPDEMGVAALADFYDRFQETAVHTIKSNAQTIRFDSA